MLNWYAMMWRRNRHMKTIDYYMNLPYKLEIISDPDEGGFVAHYPELPGCISVEETVDSVVKIWKIPKEHGLKQHKGLCVSTL